MADSPPDPSVVSGPTSGTPVWLKVAGILVLVGVVVFVIVMVAGGGGHTPPPGMHGSP